MLAFAELLGRSTDQVQQQKIEKKTREKPQRSCFQQEKGGLPCSCKERSIFRGFFAFSVPSHSMQTLQQHPCHRFGVIPAQAGDAIWAQLRLPPWPSEGLWEYPAPWGGRDAPSCTNPATSLQPRAAFNQPSGASIPMQLVAKHHLEATIPPSQAAGASQSCFAQRWDTTECPHPVLADP